MGKIIAIANQKGGVGKTTTCINLGAALVELGQKVLIVDLDSQANATIATGLKRELIKVSSYDLLCSELLANDVICKPLNNSLHIIPASNNLEKINENIYDKENKELQLMNRLEDVRGDYDFILLDCPPSLGIIIDNALFASDSIIIPVECEFFAYDALTQMVNKINQIQKRKKILKKKLTIEGVLLTKLDNRNVVGYKIIDRVRELFPNQTYKTIINHSSHLKEAPMYGKTVLQYAYNSKGSKQYRELALEVLQNNKEK